jgi:hypothetical protein
VLKDKVSDTVLDKYSELRRDIFRNVIDPATQANIRRLFENDPENAHETDPFLESLRSANSGDQQRIRGMRSVATDMRMVIEEMEIAAGRIVAKTRM